MLMQLEKFVSTVEQCFAGTEWTRLTLSQPLSQAPADLKSISLKPIQLHGSLRVQAVLKYATRDETRTFTSAEAQRFVVEQLGEAMANADLFSAEVDLFLKYFPKQRTWHLKRKARQKEAAAPLAGHNREKQRLLSSDLPWLVDLGITQPGGQVRATMQDKWRQMNKFVETIAALTERDDLPKDLHSVDMGCGKAYLTFALHHFLTESKGLQPQTVGVDRRPDLMATAQSIAHRHGLKGLQFTTADITTFQASRCDLLLALHACDTATDAALARGLGWGSLLQIVAPCCHKQVRRDLQPPPLLQPMLQHGILLERQAEMLTDTIRALLLEAHGYRTKLFEFISPEHTPKNVMITAEKVRRPQNQQEKLSREARGQIDQLKATFGLPQQALERMLGGIT
jgi:hypothetical protein